MKTSNDSTRTAFVCLLAAVLSGCVGNTVPFGYEKIEGSDRYVPRQVLEGLVLDHATRDQVIARLGQPDASNDATRTAGYMRCIDSTATEFAVLVVPLPVPAAQPSIAHCQMIKIHFDDAERAVKWADRVGVRPDDPTNSGQYYSLPCTLDYWLRWDDC